MTMEEEGIQHPEKKVKSVRSEKGEWSRLSDPIPTTQSIPPLPDTSTTPIQFNSTPIPTTPNSTPIPTTLNATPIPATLNSSGPRQPTSGTASNSSPNPPSSTDTPTAVPVSMDPHTAQSGPGGLPPRPSITLRGISKIYKGIMGINNITLDIYPGITGILGPNGAGKSTTLKIISGLISPSSGKVRVFGKHPRRSPEVLARVGYCPEHDAFYPDMTGKDFVSHFLRVRGVEQGKSLKMADLVLRRLDLASAMDRRIGGYSRGMKQKVKVAAAVVHNPDILILDEPLQGADPEARHLLIRNMQEWAKSGMTIIVSSHILQEIERMTKRVVLINEGRIYAVGEMEQIRAMMVNRPLTIQINLREPSRIRELASLLISQPSVFSVDVSGDSVTVNTLDAKQFYEVAPKILSKHSFDVSNFLPTDDNLESLYYHLMSQRSW